MSFIEQTPPRVTAEFYRGGVSDNLQTTNKKVNLEWWEMVSKEATPVRNSKSCDPG